jgi:hypothetical protein
MPRAPYVIGRAALGAIASVALVAACALYGCSSDPITQKLKIGVPCMTDSDCGSSPWFVCFTDRPGGYCSKNCLSDADCPTAESICAFDNGTGSCKAKCVQTSDCRKDYLCHAASNDKNNFASKPFCDTSGMATDGGMTPTDAGTASDAGGGAGG